MRVLAIPLSLQLIDLRSPKRVEFNEGKRRRGREGANIVIVVTRE